MNRRSLLPTQVQIPLLNPDRVSLKDRVSISGDHLVYVSTHENLGVSKKSWVAIYSTHIGSGETWRLYPYGVVDFSPAVSPSGVWTVVASSGLFGEGDVDGSLDSPKSQMIELTPIAEGQNQLKELKSQVEELSPPVKEENRFREEQMESEETSFLVKEKDDSTRLKMIHRIVVSVTYAFLVGAITIEVIALLVLIFSDWTIVIVSNSSMSVNSVF